MADAPSGGARGAPPSSISYSAPNNTSAPRRGSYASVVSGSVFSSQNNPPNSNLLPSSTSSSFPPPFLDSRRHRTSSGVDADMQMNPGWRAPGSLLPAYSRKFIGLPGYDPFTPGPGSYSDTFFTPSYLHNSPYIHRLDAAHRAKLAAQHRDASSSSTSNPLSASSSNVNLHRMAPSHRGMTYDIIEREPPGDDDQVKPLPSRWNDQDMFAGLELSNGGLEVRYTGPVNKHDHDAAAARTDHPMPPQCGIYYFEITIQSKPREGYVFRKLRDVVC